jgi:hypothetical protein
MFRPKMAITRRGPTLQMKCFTYITCMLSCMGYASTSNSYSWFVEINTIFQLVKILLWIPSDGRVPSQWVVCIVCGLVSVVFCVTCFGEPQFRICCVQFQILDVTQTEKDASGKCQVSYKSLDPHTFLKIKTDCISGKTVPFILHPDKVSALWPEWRIPPTSQYKSQALLLELSCLVSAL